MTKTVEELKNISFPMCALECNQIHISGILECEYVCPCKKPEKDINFVEEIEKNFKESLPSEKEIQDIIDSRLDCPKCNNSGHYESHIHGDWESSQVRVPSQMKCEFCHGEENSKFNLAKAISKRLRGE